MSQRMYVTRIAYFPFSSLHSFFLIYCYKKAQISRYCSSIYITSNNKYASVAATSYSHRRKRKLVNNTFFIEPWNENNGNKERNFHFYEATSVSYAIFLYKLCLWLQLENFQLRRNVSLFILNGLKWQKCLTVELMRSSFTS